MTGDHSPEAPPPLRILPWFELTSFCARDAGRFAELRVVGRLRAGVKPPRHPVLEVRRGPARTIHLPELLSQRRLGRREGADRRGVLELTLVFELPPALLGDESASLTLIGPDGELSLPAPPLAAQEQVPPPRRGRGALVSAAALAAGLLSAPVAVAAVGSLQGHGSRAGRRAPRAGVPPRMGVRVPRAKVVPRAGLTPAAATGTGTSTTATTTTQTTPATTTQTTTTQTTPATTTQTTPATTTQTTPATTTQTTPATTTQTTPATTTQTTPATTAQTTTTQTTPGATGTTTTGSPALQPVPIPDRSVHRYQPPRRSRHASRPPARAAHRRTTATRSIDRRIDRHHAHRPRPAATAPLTATPVAAPGPYSPSDWAGGIFSNPFSVGQLAQFSQLVAGPIRPPRYLVRIYRSAARVYRVPWQVLAAINYVETGYGSDLAVSPAGAIGWMQFMPGTWAEYGRAVDMRGRAVSGVADPWDPRDAIFAAARYLVASGARRNLPRAIFAYNHAGWYVDEVLTVAEEIDSRGIREASGVRRKLGAMRTAARLLDGMPYVWGGGHAGWLVSGGYDCSGFVSAVLHAAGYLTMPVTTQSLPVQPGIMPGPGRWVTIFDRDDQAITDDHVIIEIDGQFWESGGGGPDGAADVHRMRRVPAGYLQSFNLVLHPQGL